MKFTPKIVVSSERLIVSLSNFQVGGIFSSDFPSCIHLVLVGLNLILHVLAYDSHVPIRFCSPVVVQNRLISSAYAIAFSLKLWSFMPLLLDLSCRRRSSMKTLNSLGDRILNSPAHLSLAFDDLYHLYRNIQCWSGIFPMSL